MSPKTAFLASAIALALIVPAAADDIIVYGVGTFTCKKVMSDTKGRDHGTYADWVSGLMSAYSHTVLHGNHVGITPTELTNSAYKLCIDYPKMMFGAVAATLVERVIDIQATAPSNATPAKNIPGAMTF